MGNVEVHDLAPVRDDERKMLDLSRKVSFKQYTKHIEGDFHEVCLTELPWSIRDAVSLYEKMDISFNIISELPVELPLRLPHLSYLNLSYNRLSTLPESFGLLFHLNIVLLNNNRLKSLPESFTHLVKLERLDLSHNAMRDLPEDIGRMEALSKLNVCNNKLKNLPTSLGNLQTLTLILARNNRLLNPPQSVCNEGSEATIKYLKKQASPTGLVVTVKNKCNVFPRVRGTQLEKSVPNLQTAEAQYLQIQTDTSSPHSRIKTPLLPPLGASKRDASDLRDKIVGLLYGAAIGDAIGVATTRMIPDECSFHYDPENLSYSNIVRDDYRTHWRIADWTSNFDLAVIVLESIIHWGGVVDELDYAQRLDTWRKQGFKELADNEGFTTSYTIKQVVKCGNFLSDPHMAARSLLETRGKGQDLLYTDNGAVPQSIVLGIPQFHNLHEVSSNSLRICQSTHADPMCKAASVMMSCCVALILQQGNYDLEDPESVEKLIEEASMFACSHLSHDNQKQKWNDAIKITHINSLNMLEEGQEEHTLKPISAALMVLRSGAPSKQEVNHFKQEVTRLLMLGGESSTHACLAGALLGCKLGYGLLPQQWVQDIRPKQTEWLNAKINILLDMMGIP